MSSPPVSPTLHEQIRRAVEKYFAELDGETPGQVYQLVLSEVERPLLEVVMNYAEQNQTMAAKILGINRNTLKRKLKRYHLDTD